MSAAIFDWALHPWAMFAVTGLALAVFAYDFGMPLSMRSAFYPIFGKAVWGRLGDVIEVLAVFATIFGLATSLGLGAQQAMAGITFLYQIPSAPWSILGLIAVMAGVTFLSVHGGIDRGIRIFPRGDTATATQKISRMFPADMKNQSKLSVADLRMFEKISADPFGSKTL